MTKLYKLTNQQNETYNHTKWGPCVTHKTNGKGEMCGPGWLHAYTSPELAVLLNPIHANFSNPKLWECEGIIQKNDHGLKVGTTELTTICQIELPRYTVVQKVAFSILIAQTIYKDPKFHKWAQAYLSGADRSQNVAWAAAKAAAWVAAKAAKAAAWAEAKAWAAWAAAWAAEAAAEAAWAGETNLQICAEKALLIKG